MKKIIISLLITIISLTATFAAQQTKIDNDLSVKINAGVLFDEYNLNITYRDNIITEDNLTIDATMNEFNTTKLIAKGPLNIITDNGNQNSDMILKVEITPESFKGLVNGELYDTEIYPKTLGFKNRAGNFKYHYEGNILITEITNTINAGPNEALDLAEFHIVWRGNESIPAGNYSSSIQIKYTLE